MVNNLITRSLCFITALSLFLTGCVSTELLSVSKSEQVKTEKITDLMLVIVNQSRYNNYFNMLTRRLQNQLKEKGVNTESYMLPANARLDSDEKLKSMLASNPKQQVLLVNLNAKNIQNDGAGHIGNDIILELELRPKMDQPSIWRSSIEVNSGGIMGLGTINYGSGSGATTKRILSVLAAEGLIN